MELEEKKAVEGLKDYVARIKKFHFEQTHGFKWVDITLNLLENQQKELEQEKEKNKINYEIDNCVTDLDTLIALDKRAIRDLENNTHEIEQHEVLTIIREFIRLRNDYKQEKEKNKELEAKRIWNKLRIEELKKELVQEKEKNKELENTDLTTVYMSGFYDGEKKWKDKIKEKIEELEKEKHSTFGFDVAVKNFAMKILKELLEEK